MYFWSSLASLAAWRSRIRACRSSLRLILAAFRSSFAAALAASRASSSAQRASLRAMRMARRSSLSLIYSSCGSEAARLSATARESPEARLSDRARESAASTRLSDIPTESSAAFSASSASLLRCSARRFRLSAASSPEYSSSMKPAKKRSVCTNAGLWMDS